MDKGILIEPLVNKKAHGVIVQSKRCRIGLKITNLQDHPTEEFLIAGILLESSEGQNISENFGSQSFNVPILNPGESRVIDVGNFGSYIYKLVNIRTFIRSQNSQTTQTFLQKNPFTKEITKISGDNDWYDFLYIVNSTEYKQDTGNSLMITLTVVIAIFTFMQFWDIVYVQPTDQRQSIINAVAEADNFNYFVACQVEGAFNQTSTGFFLINYDTDIYSQNFNTVIAQPTTIRQAVQGDILLMEASNEMMNSLLQGQQNLNQSRPKLIQSAIAIINNLNSYNKIHGDCSNSNTP